ncbi:hypothetical protein GCM10011415_39530 [Salipiger pallidus]|uniref:Uncharacterized protein n=2 Tax=Salipiger pallidus TaxID=1775170 RepID=A0A8J2ZNR1_9RHOB|nr:hypothetical protein GCM10011415_39530 [Salipiger pallidus]
MMAPDRGSAEREAFTLSYGHGVHDLCTGEASHDHRCPFCHGLPEAPALRPGHSVFLYVPHDDWRQGRSLHRAAQARNINHSTRAPPEQA